MHASWERLVLLRLHNEERRRVSEAPDAGDGKVSSQSLGCLGILMKFCMFWFTTTSWGSWRLWDIVWVIRINHVNIKWNEAFDGRAERYDDIYGLMLDGRDFLVRLHDKTLFCLVQQLQMCLIYPSLCAIIYLNTIFKYILINIKYLKYKIFI